MKTLMLLLFSAASTVIPSLAHAQYPASVVCSGVLTSGETAEVDVEIKNQNAAQFTVKQTVSNPRPGNGHLPYEGTFLGVLDVGATTSTWYTYKTEDQTFAVVFSTHRLHWTHQGATDILNCSGI